VRLFHRQMREDQRVPRPTLSPTLSPTRSPTRSPTLSPTVRRRDAALQALDAEIASCRNCPRLVAWREEVAEVKRASYQNDTYWGRGVPGFGPVDATVLVLGLAPAAHGANRTGRVFTGDRSGDWLFRSLYRAGLANQPTSTDRHDGLKLTGCRVGAAVRCAPPGNAPTPEERTACSGFLERELELLSDLRVVLALGGFAYQAIASHLGIRRRPKFGHGVEVETVFPNGRAGTVVCSYHPSQQNTFTGTLTEPMLDAVTRRCAHLATVPKALPKAVPST
jgi:uracil-DNA glycosylase